MSVHGTTQTLPADRHRPAANNALTQCLCSLDPVPLQQQQQLQQLTVQSTQPCEFEHTQASQGCLHVVQLQLGRLAQKPSTVTQIKHRQVREGRAAVHSCKLPCWSCMLWRLVLLCLLFVCCSDTLWLGWLRRGTQRSDLHAGSSRTHPSYVSMYVPTAMQVCSASQQRVRHCQAAVPRSDRT